MKSFKTYLEEKKKMKMIDKALVGALSFGVLSGGAALGKYHRMQREAQPTVVSPTPTKIVNQTPVVAQPKVDTPKKVEAPKKSAFENEHVKKLYGALVSAEHRGRVKDPYAYDAKHYVRTRAGGGASSAYGPAQITRDTARGFAIKDDPYHTSFVNQGNKFLKSHKTHAVYGLGGSGDLSGEEHHENYQKLAVHVMKSKAKEIGVDITKPLSRDDLSKMTQHWRHGISSKNKPESWYTTTVNDFYYGK